VCAEGESVKIGPLAASDGQRILDRAARRLLEARLDGDAVAAAAGANNSTSDDGRDESALLVQSQGVPVTSTDGLRGRGGRD
jgi:hypothetical protein